MVQSLRGLEDRRSKKGAQFGGNSSGIHHWHYAVQLLREGEEPRVKVQDSYLPYF
jgi:hypothetical protein